MWLTHLKITFRNFLKDKTFGGINLLGLSIGMLSFLVLYEFVSYEWNYDQQSPHVENIWRVFNETRPDGGAVTLDANSHSAVGPSLKADLPEVVEYARLFNRNQHEVVFAHEQQPYKIKDAWFTDPGFLQLFPQEFLKGESKQCLNDPFSMVISATTAKTIFGTLDVLGQRLEVPSGVFRGTYTISGVVADSPVNTHLKFNVLASYATRYAQGSQDNWQSYWEYTYFQVHPNTDINKVKEQLAFYTQEYLENEGLTLNIQPLSDIHLASNMTYEIEPGGNGRMVNFLAIVAVLILFIAFFNYVNMMTAKALQRAKEVGLRKVIGATRRQLITQFIIEGALLNLLALLLALAFLPVMLQYFSDFINRPLVDFFVVDSSFILMTTGMFVTSLAVACLYPAIVLSGYPPIQVLRGYFGRSQEGQSLRKSLVVFQFACSTILIIAVGVVDRQLQFLRSHDLGLSLHQMVAIPSPNLDFRRDTTSFQRFNTFRKEVSRLSGVEDLTSSSVVPGLGISTISGGSTGLHRVNQPETRVQGAVYYVDVAPNFFETYDIPLLSGQTYEPQDREGMMNNVILNESACRLLGFTQAEDAVGQAIAFNRTPDRHIVIQAVAADFHIEGLQEPVRPTLYTVNPRIVQGYHSLKVSAKNIGPTLAELQHLWAELFPVSPFEYWFLNDHFSQQYTNENTLSSAFNLFAGLAIFIACLGLFGLATFTAQQRTKEIGIRKVLGASVSHIITLLSKDFLQLVLVAFILASPLAYYLLDSWLQDYAHRIQIQWWIILLAGFATIGIALLTISWKSWKAAMANPVDSLRSE